MNSALRKSTQHPSTDWFLVSGDLSVRLNRPVTLGVDAAGIIKLNAKDETARWLTLDVAPSGDGIVIAWLDTGIELRADGARLEPDTLLEPGTVIQLPGNDVYLSRSLLRGKSLHNIEVVRSKRRKAPPRESQNTALEAPIEPIAEAPITAEQARPVTQVPRRRWGMGLAAVVLFGAGIIGWQQRDVASGTTSAPQTSAAEENSDGQPMSAQQSTGNSQLPMVAQPNVEGPPEQPRLNAGEVALAGVQAADADNSAAPTTTTNASPQPDVVEVAEQVTPEVLQELAPEVAYEEAATAPADATSILLAQAEQLFTQGYYTWPEPNAAGLIDQILGMDPEHGGALELRDRMAALLLDEARAAYAEGFPGAARDQVKAVLAFHRNHGPAVELLIAWDEARLARRIASRS